MRRLVWFTIGFGIACAFCAYFEIPWLLSVIFITAAVAASLLYLSTQIRSARIAAAIMLGICAGTVLFTVHDRIVLRGATQLNGKTEFVTIIVRDYSYETDYGTAVDGTIVVGDQQYRVRVYLNEKTDLEPGNRLIGRFAFEKTVGGGAEELMHHRGQGIYLLAYQRGNCVTERFWSTPWRDLPMLWQRTFAHSIDTAFPSDSAAFAKALLLGDRTDLDYETDTYFKISGISHIIAVSGLHVSILFGLVYLASGRRRWIMTLLGIPVVVLFAAVTGFTPSITRAAIMQMLMMVAMLVNRQYDAPTALATSALVMLVHNPLVITSVSFQLSFACMGGIFLFAEPIQNWLMEDSRLGRWDFWFVRGGVYGVSVSLAAAVFTTPLVAVHFGTVSLVSLATNLLTLWVIAFVFYGIMAVCLLSLWSAGAAAWIAAIVAWPIRYVLETAKLMASLPMAAVYTVSPYIVGWLIGVYVLLGLFLIMQRKPVGLFTGLSMAMLCLCIVISWLEPRCDDFRMTMLDVGQGQAILLQSDGKTFIVDCGGDYDEDAADLTAETLLSQGIARVDGVILTHFDRDHSGGVEYLLTRIAADMLIVPFCQDEEEIGNKLSQMVGGETKVVQQDLTIRFDQTEIRILAPVSYDSGNESGICVLFHKENCDILITGDISKDAEKLILKYHTLPQVDVLVVGHHGSKYSTSEELLAVVQPTYALISVGADNSYGHPHPSILERLLQYGCWIYRTDENGTIIFRG